MLEAQSWQRGVGFTATWLYYTLVLTVFLRTARALWQWSFSWPDDDAVLHGLSSKEAARGNEADDVESWVCKGYGRYKYCGLRDDPLASEAPPVYSIKPLDLRLPELEPDQKEKLKALAQRTADLAANGGHRTDNATLLRFLSARKGNVEKAEILLREAAAWRKEMDIDRVFTHWNLEAYERCLAPWWLSGGLVPGRWGQPVGFEYIGRCNFPRLLASLPWEAILRIDIVHCQRVLAALEEYALRRDQPFAPITLVVDLRGFGFEHVQFSAARSLSRLVASRNLLLTEVADRILLIHAAAAFARAWALFKHLLDPGTAEKIQVVGKEDSLDVLRQYMDDDAIPGYLGGTRHINGDPECRLLFAPGGTPPPSAISRLVALHQAEEERRQGLGAGGVAPGPELAEADPAGAPAEPECAPLAEPQAEQDEWTSPRAGLNCCGFGL